jgi:hypothetical protein
MGALILAALIVAASNESHSPSHAHTTAQCHNTTMGWEVGSWLQFNAAQPFWRMPDFRQCIIRSRLVPSAPFVGVGDDEAGARGGFDEGAAGAGGGAGGHVQSAGGGQHATGGLCIFPAFRPCYRMAMGALKVH